MNFTELNVTVVRINPARNSGEDVQDLANEEVEEPEDGVHSLDEEYSCEECQIDDDGMGEDDENSEANDVKEPLTEGEEAGNYCDTLEVQVDIDNFPGRCFTSANTLE